MSKNTFILIAIILFTIFGSYVNSQWDDFESFQDPLNNEFGLLPVNTSDVCLSLKFKLQLINFNLNDTDVHVEVPSFSSSTIKLTGFCAKKNEHQKASELKANWKQNDRKKSLHFMFVSDTTDARSGDELRWRLKNVIYTEKHHDNSITFESRNNSFMISSPLRSRYICKDRLNVTLKHESYKDIIVQLLPETEMLPFYGEKGYGSNIYVCERTRKKTLSEAFQSKMTIMSGIVLAVSSVAVIIGHSLRRTFFVPAAKQQH
uniref:L-type lectin-like domain-containing protein n=1 Tax=Rhabditophanes sp. KR3021 TaxID=114890 RepID=A0AC35TJV1_9BILA